MAARLKEFYANEITPAMMKKFGYNTVMQVPRIEKVVINMGLGEATQNSKVLDSAEDRLRSPSAVFPGLPGFPFPSSSISAPSFQKCVIFSAFCSTP